MASRSIALVALLAVLAHCDRQSPTQPAETRTSAAAAASATTPARTAAPELVAAGVHYRLRYTHDAKASAKLPMIVAIHGLGDRPESFSAVLAGFPVEARVVFPRGLSPHGGGFSWFAIDLPPSPAAVSPGVKEAAATLARMLPALRELYPTIGKPIVTGFSQGGMLSLALATHHPEEIAAAIPIAGWLPPPLIPTNKPKQAPPIFALHGDADDVLPIDRTRESIGALRKLGFTVELREYPGVDHTLSPAMQRDLFRELARAVGEQSN